MNLLTGASLLALAKSIYYIFSYLPQSLYRMKGLAGQRT